MKTKKMIGILAIIAGVLVFVMPSFLRYIVALYLIIYGLMELK